MLQKVICMMGEKAASVFYYANRFTRRGARPKTALWLLQHTGSVVLLDKEAHHGRKQMFMSLITPILVKHMGKRSGSRHQDKKNTDDVLKRIKK